MWIVETIGFEGNRSLGLSLLFGCDPDLYLTREVVFFTIFIKAFFFEAYEEADGMLKRALARYP
jgi:hypothetical protein